MRKQIMDFIESERVIAVVRGIAPEKCLLVADALYKGGIRLLEITYDMKRPEAAKETAASIAAITKEFGSCMKIGAGTVTSPELVELTADAGGEFIVAPDTNPSVIRRALECELVAIPGAMTPTEILTAHNAGADYVKIFPASELGSSYIKAICAPINHVKLLATGGINASNAQSFIAAGAYGVAAGGNLANRKWIETGEYEKITAAADELVTALRGIV